MEINAQYQKFVSFALQEHQSGHDKSIARVTAGEGTLAGRAISAASSDSVRGLFKWTRASSDKTANNFARQIFKDAII